MRACAAALVASLSIALGCSSSHSDGTPPRGGPPFASGSRLAARVYDGGDGARMFIGWRDTMLDIDCAWRVAADGRWRCLPALPEPRAYLTDMDIVHADPTCSSPHLVLPSAMAPVPRWALLPPDAPAFCGEDLRPVRVVGVAGAVALGPDLFARVGPECISTTVTPPYVIHAVGREEPPGTFVGADLVVEPRDARLAARVLVADDGARFAIGAYDREADRPCTSLSFATDRCVPLTLAWDAGRFGDASCSIPVAYSSDGAPASGGEDCAPLAAITGWRCGGGGASVRSIEAEASGEYERDAAGACSDARLAHHRTWTFGGELDLPTLGVALAGTGRLRASVLATATGAPIAAAGGIWFPYFEDTALGVRCSVATACDGRTVCMPDASGPPDPSTLRFADAACTVPLVSVWRGPSECPPGPLPRYARFSPDGAATCVDPREIHEIGSRHDGTTYVIRDSSCVTGDPLEVGYETWTIGAPITTPLAEITERLE